MVTATGLGVTRGLFWYFLERINSDILGEERTQGFENLKKEWANREKKSPSLAQISEFERTDSRARQLSLLSSRAVRGWRQCVSMVKPTPIEFLFRNLYLHKSRQHHVWGQCTQLENIMFGLGWRLGRLVFPMEGAHSDFEFIGKGFLPEFTGGEIRNSRRR